MACFIVPAVEAAVVTAVRKIAEKKNKNQVSEITVQENTILYKSKWLTNLLWGGSALLAFEHIWHGEIIPEFPFLTAMRDADATSVMLHEMSTNGIGMALLVTVAWGGMVLLSHFRTKPQKEAAENV